MVVAVAEKQSVVQSFMDVDGNSHNVASIYSMCRNGNQTSVSMNVEGQLVTVEVALTEAINIMELLN